jgi:hypothetical protein
MLSGQAQRARTYARPLHWAWAELAVAGALAAVFLPLVVLRFVDGDEGAYLAAAALVMAGEVPYGDFLYTQMPLLPYVYGPWTAALGEDWFVARLLSVIFATALGILLLRHLSARFGRSFGVLGVALYAGAGLVLVWYVTVKTYALTALLVFGAYVLVEAAGRVGPVRWALAGGLLALAVDTRLLLAGALPAFAWAAFRSRERTGSLAALAGGFLVGLLPSAVLFANDPDRFLFGNLWYHGSRSSEGLVGDFEQKAGVIANLLGIPTDTRPHPQFLLLAVPAVAAAIVLRRRTGAVPLSLLTAALLVVVSLAPTPTYTQYVCVAVPFLIVAVVELAAVITPAWAGRGKALVAAALVVYAALAAVDVYRFTARSTMNRIAAVADVAAVVDANTRSRERVVAGWPGYLFGSGTLPVRGLENDFAPHEAASLSTQKAHRYRLATVDDVESMIRDRRTRLVVANVWENNLPPFPDFEGTARASGYRLLADVNGVRVFGLRR